MPHVGWRIVRPRGVRLTAAGAQAVNDDETKEALELALSRARMATEAKSKTGFAKHAAKVIDLATKSADLVPKALLALGVLAKLFGA